MLFPERQGWWMDVVDKQNNKAWSDYCNAEITSDEVEDVLSSPDSVMQEKLARIQNGTVREADSLPFVRYLVKHGKKDAIEYLRFAFEVGQAEATSSPWDDRRSPPPAEPALALLQAKAQQAATATSELFLKQRYIFQAMKLAVEQRKWHDASVLYDESFENSDADSPIKYWAMAKTAQAHLVAGDTAHAIYYYAQIFDRSESRKFFAYQAMQCNKLYFDSAALPYCKTDRERAAVYAISAIMPFQESLGFLRKMVNDSPTSDMIKLVMAREINKNELFYYGQKEGVNSPFLEPDSETLAQRKASAPNYFEKLRQFGLECATNPKLHDPAFWYLAVSYIEIVQKNWNAAAAHLELASTSPTDNPKIRDQIKLERLMLYVEQLNEINPATEATLIDMIEPFANSSNFRRADAFNYACNKIIKLYLHPTAGPKTGGLGCSSGNTQYVEHPEAKAFLYQLMVSSPGESPYYDQYMTTESRGNLEDTVSAHILDETIDYFNNAHPSDYDRRLIRMARTEINYLYNRRGIRALTELDYPKAIESFVHLPDSVWKDRDSEPFRMLLLRGEQGETRYYYQDTDHLSWKAFNERQEKERALDRADTLNRKWYSPPAFAHKMLTLQQTLRSATGETAAKLNYQLGCGTFNLQVTGCATGLISDERAVHDLVEPRDTFIAARAREYFETSAKQTHDRELAARCTFAAAKCERIAFYEYRQVEYIKRGLKAGALDYDWENDGNEGLDSLLFIEQRVKFRACFDRLKNQYADTRFQKEILGECAYYRDYVQGE